LVDQSNHNNPPIKHHYAQNSTSPKLFTKKILLITYKNFTEREHSVVFVSRVGLSILLWQILCLP